MDQARSSGTHLARGVQEEMVKHAANGMLQGNSILNWRLVHTCLGDRVGKVVG